MLVKRVGVGRPVPPTGTRHEPSLHINGGVERDGQEPVFAQREGVAQKLILHHTEDLAVDGHRRAHLDSVEYQTILRRCPAAARRRKGKPLGVRPGGVEGPQRRVEKVVVHKRIRNEPRRLQVGQKITRHAGLNVGAATGALRAPVAAIQVAKNVAWVVGLATSEATPGLITSDGVIAQAEVDAAQVQLVHTAMQRARDRRCAKQQRNGQ
jgi:hypothetical protein